MAKSSYLPHILFSAVVCVCVYVAGDCLRKEEGSRRNEEGAKIEHLPTTRFFAPAVQTRPGSREKFFGATNRTLQSKKAKVKRHNGDTLQSQKAKGISQKEAVPLHDKIRQIYTAEIGIQEKTGRNDGKRIEEYLAYVGLGKGNPWCAAFVCWVYGKAGITNPRTGWSPALFPESRIIWSRRRGLIQHSSFSIQNTSSISSSSIKHSSFNIQNSEARPRRADIFGIWFEDKKRIAHCGFIDDWQEKYVITVEGNTNESGSREGDGVYRKRRLISTVYKVARWVDV